MAVKPDTNDAFLREVDEELRRDELIGFWRRYGRALAAGLVVLLAAFGGWLYYQHRQTAETGDAGAQLLKIYDKIGDPNVVTAPLGDLATSGSPAYSALARINQANLLLKAGDTKGAAAKFGDVAADAKAAQPLRDFALLRQTTLQYDTLPPQTVIDRLRPLSVKGNPWFGSAGELTAAAYLEMNRRDLAATIYSQIVADDGVPPTIRERATSMAQMLGGQAPAGAVSEKKAS